MAYKGSGAEIRWEGRWSRLSSSADADPKYSFSWQGNRLQNAFSVGSRFQLGELPMQSSLTGESHHSAFSIKGRRSGNDYDPSFSHLPLTADANQLTANLGATPSFGQVNASWSGALLKGEAYEPRDPAGKWFWDRNQIMDAYQGALLGVFSRETWLLEGSAQSQIQTADFNWRREFFHKVFSESESTLKFSHQLGLSGAQIKWHAKGLLVRKNTQLLLITEESVDDWNSGNYSDTI